MRRFHLFLCFLFCTGYLISVYSDSTREYQKASDYLKAKGEVYFKCIIPDRTAIDQLTRIVSVDNVKGTDVYAYANTKEFNNFLLLNLSYEILPHPGDLITPKMFNYEKGKANTWDAYPTYTSYVQIMQQFAATYPQLCQIVETGTTVQGRKLLFAKISDNVTTDEKEPHFMYTSSMHGDETAGYVMLLHLIDYLLSNYETNQDVKKLVNSFEIWINPLANPDGTYASGDSTVQGATRYNRNSVDLNRNFPNPLNGDHPDGNQWQPETQSMMALAGTQPFTMSANFHGGSEVLNYPWDTWVSSQRITADDNWWQSISREYADTVHANSPSGYMDDCNNGITFGGDWYIVYGSRQDYMTYYRHCREITVELSSTKLVPAADLPLYWNYNYRSLLNYMKHCKKGISGVVTNTHNTPVRACIQIVNHDVDSSEVYSTSLFGDYYRPIAAGTYTMNVSATGYQPVTISNITVPGDSVVIRDVILDSIKTSNKITLSGTVLNSLGNPVGQTTPATYDVTVKLYNSTTEGELKYSEQFLAANSQGITVNKSNFNVLLGSGQSSNDLQSVLSQNHNLWVEITIAEDVLSRVPLTASPIVLSR